MKQQSSFRGSDPHPVARQNPRVRLVTRPERSDDASRPIAHKKSSNCCTIQVLVGWRVTFRCGICRRSWLVIKEAVENVEGDRRNGEEVHGRKGFTVIAKKLSHRLAGSGSQGAHFVQRETLRSDTSKPSTSNSPWMRGAPQLGFSAPFGRSDPEPA